MRSSSRRGCAEVSPASSDASAAVVGECCGRRRWKERAAEEGEAAGQTAKDPQRDCVEEEQKREA